MNHKPYTTVVCENQIQVNDIRLTYKKQSNNNVLKIPKIQTLDNWIANEYQDFLMREAANEFLILNGIEEKILWEKIIRDDLRKRQEKKITDITNIAQQVINANRIISNYHINHNELQKHIAYKEPKYFLEWRKEFQKECSKNQLITKYDFLNVFTSLQKEKTIIENENILFVSLDKSKPSHKNLFEALQKNNEVSNDLEAEKFKSIPKVHAFQNYDHEISAVVEWINKNKSKNKNKLLIMSPALEKFQVNLQNKIDRSIQPNIFSDIQAKSILNTSLKRPLSAEPIIRAAIICIKINENKLLSVKELNELLLFDNWVSSASYESKQHFANALKETKKNYISLVNLQMLLRDKKSTDQKHNFQKLENIFKIIQNNQNKWPKHNKASSWNKLIYSFLEIINFGKVNNLLSFENNNIKLLFKVINQLSNSKITPNKLSLSEYVSYLEYYLENFVPNQINEDSTIDIYGFYENPTREYDAIWLMNMNDNFWPNQEEYNPFLSKKIQEKNNLFNASYHKQFYQDKVARLSKLSKELSISFSLRDNDISLSPSPWNKEKIIIHRLFENQSRSLVEENQCYVTDHQAPAIKVSNELIIKSGCKTIENQNKCPAWAFYANRLGCSRYEEDEQYEITRRSEGTLVHRILELFWRNCKTSDQLLSYDDGELSNNLEIAISEALSEFELEHNELDSRLLSMEQNFLKSLIYSWLKEEKTRPKFSIHALEKSYAIKISKLKFNIRIDRIDFINKKNKLLIDYKTAKNPTSRKELFSDSLEDLQLPIYACFIPIKDLSGIAIGHINRDKINLYGILANDSNSIAKQLNSKIDNSNITDWDMLIKVWKERIEAIAEHYLSGDASVKFKERIDFTYCDVLSLLRLAEKKHQFELYG